MAKSIVVPELGESVVEATVGRWLRKVGETVQVGEALVELETDKANLEVGAEVSGVLSEIKHAEGDDVQIGDVLGSIEASDAVPAAAAATESTQSAAATAAPAADAASTATADAADGHAKASPAARRLARENDVDLNTVQGSGSGNRIKRGDVEKVLGDRKTPSGGGGVVVDGSPAVADAAPAAANTAAADTAAEPGPMAMAMPEPGERRERRMRMSRRRQTIARRLVESQQTAAILSTFNEIDMSAVMALRKRKKQAFEERHGVRLGFMSFFTKAVIAALRRFPAVNAEIQGNEIVYHDYYDIGIAVGAEDGLVVPVLRDADRMSFAQVESRIRELAGKAGDGSLTIDDLMGGTFTITNGGSFGSLLSTPIINPPQSGILGMHNILERPIAVDGEVVVRPMMYVALSYDHRIVDGRESVQFLRLIKELIEDPAGLLLEGS